MDGVLLQVGGQIDDLDCLKRAFLHTNTATNAERLVNCRSFVVDRSLNAQFAHAHNGTRLFAFLSAFLRLALVLVDNCDSCLLLFYEFSTFKNPNKNELVVVKKSRIFEKMLNAFAVGRRRRVALAFLSSFRCKDLLDLNKKK